MSAHDWLWLSSRLEPGPAWQVLDYFGSPEKARFADASEYERIPKLNDRQRKALADHSNDPVNEILADCQQKQIHIVTWQDSLYPDRLRQMDAPPLVLYFRGHPINLEEEIAIALVGTRSASPYGHKVATRMAFQITRQGGLVVTGPASGCDRAALYGALKAGGPVVCLVAGGVDVPYIGDDESLQLYEDVAACGCIISPRPPGTPHLGEFFKLRNEVLAGLTLGTLVTEAPMGSGALSVARLALDNNRDVYTVPANIDAPASEGNNYLLCKGEAMAVRNAGDILEFYWFRFPQCRKGAPDLTDAQVQQRTSQPVKKKASPAPAVVDNPEESAMEESSIEGNLSDNERAVLLALQDGPMTIDDLVSCLDIPVRRVSATLTVLTIRGLTEELAGSRFLTRVRLDPLPEPI